MRLSHLSKIRVFSRNKRSSSFIPDIDNDQLFSIGDRIYRRANLLSIIKNHHRIVFSPVTNRIFLAFLKFIVYKERYRYYWRFEFRKGR
jgi:hypothetical protein